MALAGDKVVNLLTVYRSFFLSGAQSRVRVKVIPLQFFKNWNSNTQQKAINLTGHQNTNTHRQANMHVNTHAVRQTNTVRIHILNSTLPAARLSFALSPLQNHNSITVKRECNVLNTNLQSPIHFYWVNPEDNNVSLGEMGGSIPSSKEKHFDINIWLPLQLTMHILKGQECINILFSFYQKTSQTHQH